MYLKMASKKALFIFLLSLSIFSRAERLPPEENQSVYSSYKSYPSGDCGGFTLTLVQNKTTNDNRGFFQAYEGNCEDDKRLIKIIKLNSTSGEFTFSAPTYAQAKEGGLEIIANWKFSGRIEKNKIVGKIQSCQINGSFCSSLDQINLPKVKRGTP
jgi:hypothetical protein